jgi:hypothetical protein
MFEWSKGICKKIKESGCLEPRELQMVEIALRMNELNDMIYIENLGISSDNMFELEHAIHKNAYINREVT